MNFTSWIVNNLPRRMPALVPDDDEVEISSKEKLAKCQSDLLTEQNRVKELSAMLESLDKEKASIYLRLVQTKQKLSRHLEKEEDDKKANEERKSTEDAQREIFYQKQRESIRPKLDKYPDLKIDHALHIM